MTTTEKLKKAAELLEDRSKFADWVDSQPDDLELLWESASARDCPLSVFLAENGFPDIWVSAGGFIYMAAPEIPFVLREMPYWSRQFVEILDARYNGDEVSPADVRMVLADIPEVGALP
jgi:hypothetical protein